MKNIILFDTAVGTTNTGDEIIMNSTLRGMKEVLKGNYVVNFPTHTTPFSFMQTLIWWKAKWVENADLKFICGTNLLATNLMYPTNDLNINVFNCRPLKGSVLVGVGNSLLNKKTNFYTQYLYKQILSKDYIHSTRDEETTEMLRSYGFKAVTTGCPTLWELTPEHCRQIPTKKADEVIFTLTGVQRDEEKDQKMLDILRKNYNKRYFYVQTIWDMDYFKTLKDIDDVEIVEPSLEAYADILENKNIDYVGTRLHGGVFAMQHKVRTVIISIDNRARNINKVNNLNVIERQEIDKLHDYINSEIKTEVRIDYEVLNKWRRQFVM